MLRECCEHFEIERNLVRVLLTPSLRMNADGKTVKSVTRISALSSGMIVRINREKGHGKDMF